MELPEQDEGQPGSRVHLTGTQRVCAVLVLGSVVVGLWWLTKSETFVLIVLAALLLVLEIRWTPPGA